MIIKGKRIYATRMKNKQFLSSREVSQSSDGKEFSYIDGVLVKTMCPDLTFGEGFRYVDLHIELKEFPGGHQMWLAGRFQHRFLTEDKPDYNGDDGYLVTGGDILYLSFNCDVDYFPRLPEGIYPVWVECTKSEPYDEDDYRLPLCFDTEGTIDRDGDGCVSFSGKLRGQLQKFLDDNGISFLKCPLRCRLVLEIEQKKDNPTFNFDAT